MWRFLVPVVVPIVAVPFLMTAAEISAAESPLISETEAARHGLTRPWFAQAALDRGRSRLNHLAFYDGTVYVQSDRGLVQALDAETGAELWSRQIGRPDHPTLPLGVGKILLAVAGSSRLYVLNRRSGELLQEDAIDGTPGGGPAVGEQWIYVPLLSGTIVAYRIERQGSAETEELEKKKRATEHARQRAAEGGAAEATPPATPPAASPPAASDRPDHLQLRPELRAPLRYQSKGHALVPPLVLRESDYEEHVAWPTDAGYLYVGRIDREKSDLLEVRYRLETTAPISVPAAYVPPDPEIDPHWGTVIAASEDGTLTALHEQNGKRLWRSSLGEPVVTPLAVIGKRVYAATQFGGLHCLDVKTGEEQWNAPGALQFTAQSKTRVYAGDRLGRLLILDAQSGVSLDRLNTAASPLKLSNTETDRIYLATPAGLIQCLHELEQKEPIRYGPPARPKAKPAQPPKKAGGPAKSAPGPAGPAEEEENPFKEQ